MRPFISYSEPEYNAKNTGFDLAQFGQFGVCVALSILFRILIQKADVCCQQAAKLRRRPLCFLGAFCRLKQAESTRGSLWRFSRSVEGKKHKRCCFWLEKTMTIASRRRKKSCSLFAATRDWLKLLLLPHLCCLGRRVAQIDTNDCSFVREFLPSTLCLFAFPLEPLLWDTFAFGTRKRRPTFGQLLDFRQSALRPQTV